MSLTRKLVFELFGRDVNAGRTFNNLSRNVDRSTSRIHRVGHVASLAMGGIAVAAAVIGKKSVDAADAFETSQAKYETSLNNVGSSLSKVQPQVSALDKRMERFGFTNADVDESLANLTTALGKPKVALSQLGLAADLARFKHIGLAEASTAVAKAEEGNLRAVKALGIDLPISAAGAVKLMAANQGLAAAQRSLNQLEQEQHAKAHLTLSDHIALANAKHKVALAQDKVNASSSAGHKIVSSLSRLLGGTAAKASETFAGKEARLKAQLTDLGVKVGLKLLPALTSLADYVSNHVIPALSTFGHWAQKNSAWLKPLVGLIVAGWVAFKAYEKWTKLAAAANLIFGKSAVKASGESTVASLGTMFARPGAAAGAETAGSKFGAIFASSAANPIAAGVVAAVVMGFSSRAWQKSLTAEQRDAFGGVAARQINPAGTINMGKFGIRPVDIKGANTDIARLRSLYSQLNDTLGGLSKTQQKIARAALSQIKAAISSASAQAEVDAMAVGEGLVNGISAGMAARKGAMLAQAKALGGQAGKAIRFGAQVSSPSKITKYVGRMLAEGIVVGFTGASGKVFRSLSSRTQSILDQLNAMTDRGLRKFHNAVDKTASKLKADIGARKSLIGQVRDSLLGGTDLSGAFTQDDTGKDVLGNVGTFFTSKLAGLKRFLVDLRLLRKRGLASNLLQMIAAAGPDQGDQIARQVLANGNSAGGVRDLNKTNIGLRSTATAIGTVVGNATDNKRIARDRKDAHDAAHELKRHTRLLEGIIEAIVDSAIDGPGLHKALLRLKRHYGKELGLS